MFSIRRQGGEEGARVLGDEKVTVPALDDIDDDVDVLIDVDDLEPLPKALVGAYLIG